MRRRIVIESAEVAANLKRNFDARFASGEALWPCRGIGIAKILKKLQIHPRQGCHPVDVGLGLLNSCPRAWSCKSACICAPGTVSTLIDAATRLREAGAARICFPGCELEEAETPLLEAGLAEFICAGGDTLTVLEADARCHSSRIAELEGTKFREGN
jgi:hypothetical protein